METNEKIAIKIQPELAKAIEDMGFTEYTDIQIKSIPLIQQGKDIMGQSFTGSGKTAAFGLPILEKTVHGNGISALVLVPTRELCEQVTGELRKFSKYKRLNIIAVYGGVSINPQIMNLRKADIVVGTPGRILDHMQRGTVNFSKVRQLVLDEADKMFEMGFIDDVKRIISQTPEHRQTLLFSATMPHEVMDIVRHYMKHPEKVKGQTHVDKGKMIQHYYDVNSRDKFSLLVHILNMEPEGIKMIFCATRNRVDLIGKNLAKNGIKNERLHGGLSQNRRKQAIDMFHNGEIDVLVASDVAARGLDIKNVAKVINYDLPKNSKEYIHRIGRTARAGMEGKVVSLLSHEDHDNFRSILDDRSIIIEKLPLPEFKRVEFFARMSYDRDERPRGHGGRSFGGGRRFGSGGGYGSSRGSSYGRSSPHGRSSGGYGRRPSSSNREGSSSHGHGERSHSGSGHRYGSGSGHGRSHHGGGRGQGH